MALNFLNSFLIDNKNINLNFYENQIFIYQIFIMK